jgi:hypothetical protein
MGQRTPSPPRPAATGHVVLDEDPLTRGAKSSVLPVDKLCAWAYTECHRGGLGEWTGRGPMAERRRYPGHGKVHGATVSSAVAPCGSTSVADERYPI